MTKQNLFLLVRLECGNNDICPGSFKKNIHICVGENQQPFPSRGQVKIDQVLVTASIILGEAQSYLVLSPNRAGTDLHWPIFQQHLLLSYLELSVPYG